MPETIEHGPQRRQSGGEELEVTQIAAAAIGCLRIVAITVAGTEIVGVRLTQLAYAHGFALALPNKGEVARPTGLEPATFGSGTQRSIH